MSSRVFVGAADPSGRFVINLLGMEPAYLNGVLHFRYPKGDAIQCKRVTVAVQCKEKTRWTTSTYINGRNYTQTHVGEFTHINPTPIVVWQSEKGGYEAIDNLDVPFSILLPADAPSSFSTDHGSIKYKINIRIERKGGLLKSSLKLVKQDLDGIRRFTYPPDAMSLQPHSFSSPPDCPKIRWSLTLPRVFFSANTTQTYALPFHFVFLDPSVKIKRIRIRIKTYITLRCKTTTTKDSKGNSLESIVPGESLIIDTKSAINELHHNLPLTIPDHIMRTTNSRYISAGHRLKLQIELKNAPDVYLEQTIVIGDAPPAEWYSHNGAAYGHPETYQVGSPAGSYGQPPPDYQARPGTYQSPPGGYPPSPGSPSPSPAPYPISPMNFPEPPMGYPPDTASTYH